MIIDTHAHIGKLLNFDMKTEEILASMKRWGIAFSLFSDIEAAENAHDGTPVPDFMQKPQNQILKDSIREAKKAPDRLGVLAWLKIRQELPDEEYIELLERNRELIYGFKLHPFHSRVAPDSERLEPIYALAARLGLPVVSHTGGCEEARSIHLYNAAKAHPEINFVMVHLDLGTDNSEAVELLGKLDNLYGDTTWVPIESAVKAIKKWGSKKLLFGTDNPIDGPDTLLCNGFGERSLYQQYFNELKELVTPGEYEDLMYKNAQRLFKIKANENE